MIVEGGGQQCDTDVGKLLGQRIDDVGEALRVGIVSRLIEVGVGPVIHPEHDCHDGWLVGEDITLQACFNAAAFAAADPVAVPPGIDKLDMPIREACQDKGLDIACIALLLGDGVAVKDNRVAVKQ